MQFIFAGKAHPADDAGKEMIRQIVSFAADHGIRHRFVFLPDYDIAVARAMYHGCRHLAEHARGGRRRRAARAA